MDRLARALDESREDADHMVSVLFIDLDRFKNVNDSLGHLIGDELLKEIGSRLRECLRPDDMVARLGGDEFTVLVHGTYAVDEVTHIGDRIQQALCSPFLLRGHEIYSSASIGILHASPKHETPEDIMRDADTAMYHAKRSGKARYEIFDETMHSEAKENLQLETELRRALDRGEIDVFYQPIYDLQTGRVTCVESLARWEHADLGRIAPDRFIPLAEELGLIDRLCEHVLARACTEIASVELNDDLPFLLSVNLSCRQFSRRSLVQRILTILQETAFPADRLKLEITESVFFEHQDRAIDMLNELRNEGVQIDIDDFGTGYSNLGFLQKLPVAALKIDRSFVTPIAEDGQDGEIVKAIITLARNLGLAVVAEGIETSHQLEFLKGLGCDEGQGFLLAPPASLEGLLCVLHNSQPFDVQRSDITSISSIEVLQ
jgi:diguanylate cyclase (GGDEF)-like protein